MASTHKKRRSKSLTRSIASCIVDGDTANYVPQCARFEQRRKRIFGQLVLVNSAPDIAQSAELLLIAYGMKIHTHDIDDI